MHLVELETDDDVWSVRELAIAHHAEFGEGRSFDATAVTQSALECRKQSERLMNCWLVYDNTGKAIAYLAATTERLFHSYRRTATQQMFYVRPESRGTRAAIMLMRAFEQWARSLNCEAAFMQVEHNTYNELTVRISELYTRLGFTMRGAVHIKNLED